MRISASVALLLGLTVTGCGGSGPPAFTQPPTVAGNPNPAAPLAAVVRFEASESVATSIQVTDGENSWQLSYDAGHSPEQGLAVVGLRPDRRHHILVTIRDETGLETTSDPVDIITPPLPTDPTEFPPIQVNVARPDRMEPGVTLFSPRRARAGDLQFGAGFGMLVAVDHAGEVVWYYRTDSRISDLERLANGHLIYLTQDYHAVEIDLLGNVVAQWYAARRPHGPADAIPVDTLAFHHEVDELPSGNLVVLGVDRREIDGYYTSETDPDAPRVTRQVMGDEVVEFARDGTVVWRWNAFDHLDPFFIGYNTFDGYWARRGFPGTVDWTHGNGLLYDASDDSLLVNLRHLSAVVKVDRASGTVRWILGDPDGWPSNLQGKMFTLQQGGRWFAFQHAPVPTPHGTLLLFDNGNFQARPFTRPTLEPAATWSRAVEYALDEDNRVAREVWSSEGPGPDSVVSSAMGDVDWLPRTGNVLVHYGAMIPRDDIEGVTWDDFLRKACCSRIREYTHTEPAEVVWELVLRDSFENGPIGWSIYGGERLPSLLP
jgi:hypothetical protein